jgi:phage FluMu protein Com
MNPKYHPTPLSGGDRKALNKELGKARAMTNILAAQSAEMRAKAETMLQ